MQLKHLVASLALGAALGAQAQVGPIPNGGDAGLLDDKAASFIDAVQGNGTNILGVFNFSLGALSNVAAGVANFPVEGSAEGAFGSALTSLSLFNLADLTTPVLADITPEDSLLIGGQLAAGTYFLAVTGASIGTDGGAYAGLLAAQTVPVPEASTSSLLALGLAGLLGAAQRRRRLR